MEEPIRVLLNLYYKLPFRPFRKSLAKLFVAYRKKDEKKIVKVNRKGINIMLNLGDAAHNGIYYGIYKNLIADLMEKELKPGDVFVEVGASIGYFALLAAKLIGPEGKVYAFEPSTPAFIQFKENLSLNNFNNITLEKVGISDKKSKSYEGLRSEYTSSSGRVEEEVIFTTLDEYFKGNKINKLSLLHIDTDGFGDFDVMRGSMNIIRKFKPTIVVKIQPPYKGDSKEYFKKFIDFLFSLEDYIIYSDTDGLKQPFSKQQISDTIEERNAFNIILKRKI